MRALFAMDKSNKYFYVPDDVKAQPMLLSDKTLTKTISTLLKKLSNPIDPKIQSTNGHLYTSDMSISHLVDILGCMRNI